MYPGIKTFTNFENYIVLVIFTMNKLYSSIDLKRLNKNKHITFLNKKENIKGIDNKRKAIFFDRDGVLINDVNYIKRPEEVNLLNGVIDVIKYAKKMGFLIFVITNQSGIARGFFTWEDYEKVSKKMLEIINFPEAICAIYANGEGPNNLDNNSWRKPNPTMILRAAKDFNLDLENSILVGDRLSDLISGEKAGIKNLVHVSTGHGVNERIKIIEKYSNLTERFNLSMINDLTSFPSNELFSKKKIF